MYSFRKKVITKSLRIRFILYYSKNLACEVYIFFSLWSHCKQQKYVLKLNSTPSDVYTLKNCDSISACRYNSDTVL